MNLFEPTDDYEVITFPTKDQWADHRSVGIGGSDAASFMGCGFRNLNQLWHDKREGSSFKGNAMTEYGNTAEPALRTLYQAKHLDQDVQYRENTMLVSRHYPYMFYSPDGLILTDDGRRGILEIKTYYYRSQSAYESDWGKDWPAELHKVPDKYYCQVLHGLLVTNFDFVIFSAEIRHHDGTAKLIERMFTREEAAEDLEILQRVEEEKWYRYFEGGEEPPLEIEL